MITAIIQARMGSTRLPGKTLALIGGEPMLGHVLRRARSIRGVEQVVVATTDQPADEAIRRFAEQDGAPVATGSERDVLDRIYQTAQRFRTSVVVRVTPDCPLLDAEIAARVLDCFLRAGGALDYASNVQPPTFPDGLDTEVISFAALERAWREAASEVDREHVTSYIWKNPDRFRLGNVSHSSDLSGLRWTVDTAADLEFVRGVYAGLGRELFGLEEVLRLLEREPELGRRNQGSVRNEGYYRSLAAEPAVPAAARILERSRELRAKAERLIPSCTQTFSKGPTQFVQGVAPVFLERARGSRVWDVDGNEYLDYIGGLGPVILGHGDPAVDEAVRRQLEKGACFSLPHPLEVELAELLCQVAPCAEMVRFGKNGSDATAGAVRAARAYTSRDKIACCGYHGWQDWYIGSTTRNRGVPRAVAGLTATFEYNNPESLERIFAENPDQVAAVILEPVGVVEPQKGFLQEVAAMARRYGALLIFDEIVTGFRWALGGAQEYFGVTPDLACFGKALGNGFPISAVAGRREVMQIFDQIFFSFTFGGEAVSLAAAVATIRRIRENPVIQHVWNQGQRLKDGYNVMASEFGLRGQTECVGYPCRTVLAFRERDGRESLVLKSLFQQEVLKRGILSAGYHNVSFAHQPAQIDSTLRVYRTALEILAEAVESGEPARWLEGAPVEPVFRRL